MPNYEITNITSGVSLGVYWGKTEQEAYDNLLKDAGDEPGQEIPSDIQLRKLWYGWLAEYMGDSTTSIDADKFGEFLCAQGFEVPTSQPSNGTKSITRNGEPIEDFEWEVLMDNCFK